LPNKNESAVVVKFSIFIQLNTGSSSSTSVKDKKARKEPVGAANSPCLGTPAKKMKLQLAASQAERLIRW